MLDAVDAFVPLPTREVDKPFLMCVEDVFNIEGRGTVVTGRVERGVLKRMEEGEIEIESIQQITIEDITHQLAIESGFLGVIDLLKVAKHGPGDNVYLIRFHYLPPRKAVSR